MIHQTDPCATLLLALALAAIGQKMVQGQPTLSRWGTRLSGVVFVLYVLYEAFQSTPRDAQDWLDAVLRGLLTAGIAWGFSLILLAVVAFVFRYTLAGPFTKIREFRHSAKQKRAKRRAEREEEEKRRREQLESERTRPERERAQREAEVRSSAQENQRSQAQKRRELARMDCELLWIAYAPAIQQQFGKPDLQAFLAKYMADSQPAEFVEERAGALKTTLTTLYTSAEPTKKYKSIEEAIAGFDRAKERIAQEHFEDPEFQQYLKLELDKIKAQHLAAVIKNMGA